MWTVRRRCASLWLTGDPKLKILFVSCNRPLHRNKPTVPE
jgi:hypothetical protein